jgi:SPP1 gp7 family putative phage head morphogenesis protein
MALDSDVKAPSDITSTNETLVDMMMERAVDLLRLEAGTRDKVIGILDTLGNEITAAIAKIDPSGPARAAAQRARLVRLLDIVRKNIAAAYRQANTMLASETRDVADVESTWTGNAMNAAMQAEFADVGLTRVQLDALASDVLIQGAPTKDWWARQSNGLTNLFADQMRRGIALGETNDQLVKRVRGKGGIIDVSKSSAERLVRSSVQTVANAARQTTYANNADLIKALRWHSTLDTSTSDWCLVRDSLLYGPVDHNPIDHDVPWLEGPGAIHWNCRSTSVPIMKSWRDLGIDADEVPQTTRASMDGQVPAATTFESWLKKQSATRQDTTLGAAKAKLWRDGKITLRDLLDQSGRPVTAEQLRAKAARKN